MSDTYKNKTKKEDFDWNWGMYASDVDLFALKEKANRGRGVMLTFPCPKR
jgi:hypothetical protein